MAVLPNSGIETHPDGTGSLNAIVNGNWNIIDGWVNPAQGNTAAKANTLVTATVAIFTSENIGDIIRFANGVEAVIQAGSLNATPSINCTVSVNGTVTLQAFLIYAAVAESPRTLFARALTKKTKAANIAAGTTPVWDATAQKFKPADPQNVSRIYASDASGLSNTTAEFTLLNTAAINIPANTIVGHDCFHLKVVGFLGTAAVPGTLTFRFKVNGVTEFSVVATPPANLSAGRNCQIDVFIKTNSTASFFSFVAEVHFSQAATGSPKLVWDFGGSDFIANINTTLAIPLALTAQFGTANVANFFTGVLATLVKING